MSYKLLLAATVSLGLGTSLAMAQNDTAEPSGPGPEVSQTWDSTVGDALFSDPEFSTLRPQAEIETNWGNLTEEQQAEVRARCATMDTAAAPEAPVGDSTAAVEPDTETTTGSVLADDEVQTAAMGDLCDWVDTM